LIPRVGGVGDADPKDLCEPRMRKVKAAKDELNTMSVEEAEVWTRCEIKLVLVFTSQ
jgi:hypothetical protein